MSSDDSLHARLNITTLKETNSLTITGKIVEGVTIRIIATDEKEEHILAGLPEYRLPPARHSNVDFPDYL